MPVSACRAMSRTATPASSNRRPPGGRGEPVGRLEERSHDFPADAARAEHADAKGRPFRRGRLLGRHRANGSQTVSPESVGQQIGRAAGR